MTTFKVGDKVRVVRKVDTWIMDVFQNCWTNQMDDAIGLEFTVKRQNSYGVRFDDTLFWQGFPPASLELIAADFKVGDKVKVVRKTEPTKPELCWVTDMNAFIGQVFEISEVSRDGIYFTNGAGEGCAYPRASLELVTEEVKPLVPAFEFKVGDVVKIARKVEPGEELEDECNWIREMDKMVGTRQTISRVDKDGIRFEGMSYWYPRAALELVERRILVTTGDILKIIQDKLRVEELSFRTGCAVYQNAEEIAEEIRNLFV